MKTVKWAELTGPEVAELAQTTDVAILPVGCLEMHGPHLPTSTDAIVAEGVSVLAAEMERAVVLPTLYYNVNAPMKCYPGTVSVPPRLVADLCHVISEEAARNGFKKVVLFSAHGGCDFAGFVQDELLERKTRGEQIDYTVFSVFIMTVLGKEQSDKFDGHGGAMETSLVLGVKPELVKLNRVERSGPILSKKVPGASYRMDWIRQVPEGYKNDPRKADSGRGKTMIQDAAGRLAEIIGKIKAYRPDCDP